MESRNATGGTAYSPPVEKLLTASRKWSETWGTLLWDALHLQAPRVEPFVRLSQSYVDWVNSDMGGSAAQLLELMPELESDEAMRLLMKLNFHRMNCRAQHAWQWLLYGYPEAKVAQPFIDRSRFELAVNALTLVEARDVVIADDAFFAPDAADVRSWNTGALTELDAMIAMLQMSHDDPSIVVLPAPAQFEQLAGRANADFIVVDRERLLARGVQTKAAVTDAAHERYDTSRITLIDGSRDLHNTRAVRTDPRRSDKRTVPWPGLIAGHYLREMKPSRATDRWISRQAIIQKKLAARHYTGTIPSRNALAYEVVARRILHDLEA